MDVNEKGIQTQLANIQSATGKSLDELSAVIRESGLQKHGEIRAMLQNALGLSFVHADTLILCLKQMEQDRAAAKAGGAPDPVEGMYTGAKAALRPIHEGLMARLGGLGDFEIAPKKGYLSLRRKKQFATVGPATNTRVEVGLNMKGADATDRLVQLPAGKICNYSVKLTDASQVDDELIAWVRQAYEAAA